jgi:hypothetical protein
MSEEHWLSAYWRPACAIVYLIICLWDFLFAPLMTIFINGYFHESLPVWQPLTLQGSSFFHLSFMAILGVSAWTRGMKQIEEVKQGN